VSLVVENLSVAYGSVRAARSISIVCNPGEVVTIVGPNGAGKSSVLFAIAGASQGKVTGRVAADEADISGMPPEAIIRHGVSLVPEGRRIFGSLSVLENLQIGAVLRRDRREVAADIEHMFERFPALSQRRAAAGGTLSGGEAQQLAIARALLSRPRYLLLDEPSLGLAPLVIAQVFEIVRQLRAEGLGVLLVEQNAIAAMELADRALLMLSGEVRRSADAGSGDDLIADYFSSELNEGNGSRA
jgi:branched-chain amino acid transport system ATP-binding protein